MTIKHTWVSDELLHTQYIGHVTGEDMLNAAHEVGADPRMEHIRYVIGDWLQVGEAEITADHVRELAAYIFALSKSYPRVKNASLVANYESGVARATLYDVLSEDSPWEMATFGKYEDAIAWFGLIDTKQPPADNTQ